MCGRFTETAPFEKVKERFEIEHAEAEPPPRYNIAPGQDVGVVVPDNVRALRMMRWGLVPSWAKDEKIGYRMINARAETLTEKPSFRTAFKRRRCLIPADGFYEWEKSAGASRKIPYRFILKNGEIFAFAGLWDTWRDAHHRPRHTFTIITTSANDLVRRVHERMPVILRREDEAAWLDPEEGDPRTLSGLLAAYPAKTMEAYEVSTRVNSAAHEGPECIQRI